MISPTPANPDTAPVAAAPQSLYSALVVAGSRKGAEDLLAKEGGVSHKCFINIAGEPMLLIVVRALLESGRIGHVVVSVDEAARGKTEALLAPLGGHITVVEAQSTLGSSVLGAIDEIPDLLPLVITTGDNALHTPEMVRYFCDELDQSECDAALGLTLAEILLKKFPEGNRAFHRFRDIQVSGCNIYALLNRESVECARVFDSGGQFAKKPWRFFASFGLAAFLVYKSRMATFTQFLSLLSRGVHAKVQPIFMPFPEGPIDVDRLSDWHLAERIILERRHSASGTSGHQESG
ncbi:NTP transferase domain-containing protein [Parasphingorhabdus sp.]|uniref:nucleotidyltransferase family protein n=1 Tax=Parasphingorhabdus sp. TaxID=2709688 RepID=UPI0035949168